MLNNHRDNNWQVLVKFTIHQKPHPFLYLVIQGLKSGKPVRFAFMFKKEIQL